MARYPSGQRGQTVNLLANAFGGSNPPLATSGGQALTLRSATEVVRRLGDQSQSLTPPMTAMICGNSSAVERQPSKLGVAGSNPVSRSRHGSMSGAHVAQSVEHVLGKDGVTGSSPVMGSIFSVCGAR